MERRTVLRALVATGGLSALSACLELESGDIPSGNPDGRPARQHAWNDRLERDDDGNPRLPEHHVFLSLSYTGTNGQQDASLVEDALTDLERAYEGSNDGLLFTLGYSPAYFERFDRSVEDGTTGTGKSGGPLDGVDLPPPEPLHPDEHVATDDADAFLHLASDHASAVMATRQALFGDQAANGVAVTSLDGLFEQEARRTGFVGPGLPAARDENLLGIPRDEVSTAAPNFMDFRSGFRGSQAREERVTLQSGRFAGGTTQHVETIRFLLQEWYERPTAEQVARLFSPTLDPAAVGDHGEQLTDDNPVDASDSETLVALAEDHGVVGHVQKMARFRDSTGRPPILRRDVNSDDFGEAGMVFVSLQRRFEEFRRLRLAMDGRDVAERTPVHDRRDNGILQYFRTRKRGNFLIPPRELRALP
jgi:hypothetical protein